METKLSHAPLYFLNFFFFLVLILKDSQIKHPSIKLVPIAIPTNRTSNDIDILTL